MRLDIYRQDNAKGVEAVGSGKRIPWMPLSYCAQTSRQGRSAQPTLFIHPPLLDWSMKVKLNCLLSHTEVCPLSVVYVY